MPDRIIKNPTPTCIGSTTNGSVTKNAHTTKNSKGNANDTCNYVIKSHYNQEYQRNIVLKLKFKFQLKTLPLLAFSALVACIAAIISPQLNTM